MSQNKSTLKAICMQFFEKLSENIYKCKCGKVLKKAEKTGWSNLMQHIRSQHGDVKTDGAQSSLDFLICKKAENIFHWIEWVVMELKPLTFVESEYTRKNFKLDKISVNSIIKYMHLMRALYSKIII